MAIRTIYNCDECGCERREANHWFSLHLQTFKMSIHRWPEANNAENVIHVCGEECLQKRIAKWASKQVIFNHE